jgi:hypothetical protein
MARRDISIPTYYLDSCVLLDLIEHPQTQEPAKTIAAVMAAAEQEKCVLVTSVMTIVEVLYAKHEIQNRAIDPVVQDKIDRLWHSGSSPIILVDVHEMIARDAVQLLRDQIKWGWAKGSVTFRL